MTMLLQILLSISITLITILLALLLIQARRTAASVQKFAESATCDLHQAALDIHELRLRVEAVSQLAAGSLEHPSWLTQVITGLVVGLKRGSGRPDDLGRWLEALMTGLQTVLHWVRGRKAEPQKEECHE